MTSNPAQQGQFQLPLSWSWDASLEDRMANLLLGSATLHDFTFRLGPNPTQDWVSVHKIIIASGSPIFYRIITDAVADHVDASDLVLLDDGETSAVAIPEFRRLIEVEFKNIFLT